MQVAIVHDYVTQRGGAERVLLSMLKAYPSAPLYTSLYSPRRTFPEFRHQAIQTSTLNYLPFLRSHHRLAFPLLAPAVSRMQVQGSVVLCSSSGWAHGVTAEGRKIVFCHAPARWLYQTEAYLGPRRRLARSVVRAFRSPLARWDRRAADGARRYLANSTMVRDQIRQYYGIEAEVVPPPHSIEPKGSRTPIGTLKPGFFLCVSRLLPYKHVDAVIEAFRHLQDDRLVIVGSGPEERRLRLQAPSNVLLLGNITDGQLRWLYDSAVGLVAASFEDYGLTPLEAAAFGKPTAALRWGGYLDTVVEGETGVFFDQPEPKAIRSAVLEMSQNRFTSNTIQAHATQHSEERFIARLRAIVDQEITANA